MKILLLSDQFGIEMQVYKGVLGEDDLIIKVKDTTTGSEVNFTLDPEDRESLICELARLRNVKL